MKLTYRGISYSTDTPTVEVTNIDVACKYRLSYHQDANKIVWLRPLSYYAYRGVSYTKYIAINTKTKILS